MTVRQLGLRKIRCSVDDESEYCYLTARDTMFDDNDFLEKSDTSVFRARDNHMQD